MAKPPNTAGLTEVAQNTAKLIARLHASTGVDFHRAPDGPDWQVRLFFRDGEAAAKCARIIADMCRHNDGGGS